MAIDLRGRHFLKEIDFTQAELAALIDLAMELKAEGRGRRRRLAGRNLALIFQKTSTRTRAAFEVAAHHQGAHVTYLDPAGSQFGHKESVADSAKVLSRMFDGIEFRGHAHAELEEFAAASRVPVFNGLTDDWHPTQMLADFMTMRERASEPQSPPVYAYVGDARFNMGRSLLVMGAIMGADVRIAAPRELWPARDVIELAEQVAAQSGASLLLTDDPIAAVVGAEFVHTDVWVSLGEPAEVWAERIALLRPYRVTSQLLAAAGRPDVKFLHCLPAFHDTSTSVGAAVAEQFGLTDGIEVASDVFAADLNVAFDQAENRLHTIEALLVAVLGDEQLG